jgi:hypothetical protein
MTAVSLEPPPPFAGVALRVDETVAPLVDRPVVVIAPRAVVVVVTRGLGVRVVAAGLVVSGVVLVAPASGSWY